MIKTFTVVVEKDPESGWLVGEVVELAGCYTQAPDLTTLEANMKEAIQAYFATADQDAIREFHKNLFWKDVNRAFEEMRNDLDASREYDDEIKLFEGTISDGLVDES